MSGSGMASNRPRRTQRGQSTVELVLVLPFFAILLLVVVQVALLVRTRVVVVHATREAVREAAVGADDTNVRAAAIAAADLDPSRVTVSVVRESQRVRVQVTYRESTDVPIVGRLAGDAVFTEQATMRLE